MKIPVQVLASRHYSFVGDDKQTVNLVEVNALVQLGENSTIGKFNFKGTAALVPGNYVADIRASERNGKLLLGIGALTPSATAYAAASGAKS